MTGGFKAISRWSAKRHHGEAAAKNHPGRDGSLPPANGVRLAKRDCFRFSFIRRFSQIGFINSLSAFLCVICGFTVRFLIEARFVA